MIELGVFLFAVMLMLFLGGIVLVNDLKSESNRLFFLWVVFATCWMISNFLENLGALSLPWRTLLLQIDFGVSVYATSILLLFVLVFIGVSLKNWQKFLVVTPGIAMMILSFTSLVATDVHLNSENAITYDEGVLYEPYGIVILSYVVGSALALFIARRRAAEAKRAQMSIMAWSLLATLLIAIPINFFLQNTLPYQVVRIGIFAFLIFVGGTTYAIAKHEFLKVQFLVMEVFLLGMLATILTRLLLSTTAQDFFVNLTSVLLLLILGLFLIRSVLREVAQRKKLEVLTTELKKANDKLRELDKLKTEFLSIASHQLRTPLSVIRGYVSMIQEGTYGKFSKGQMGVIGQVRTSTETLIELVNQLLNVSRIESGRVTLEIEPTDLSPLCSEIANFLSIRAKERGLELTCVKPPKGLAKVSADPAKVKEVMMNLVENALKYTDKGFVRIYLYDEPHTVRVAVTDSGNGLTKEDMGKLFQKFSRAESASVNGASGTGLGLYVCKRLIEAMDGEIWAESTGRGKGSTFTFRLRKVNPASKKTAKKKKVV